MEKFSAVVLVATVTIVSRCTTVERAAIRTSATVVGSVRLSRELAHDPLVQADAFPFGLARQPSVQGNRQPQP